MALTKSQKSNIDKARIREQLGDLPPAIDYPKSFKETIYIQELPFILEKRVTNSDTTVCSFDDPVRGKFNSGFTFAAYTGESLGETTRERAINPSNIFREVFIDTDNIMSSDASKIDTTNRLAEVPAGESVMSQEVFKNLVNINNATPYFDTTGSMTVKVTADDGNTWADATSGSLITFGQAGTEGSKFPLTFPFTFGGEGGQVGQVLRWIASAGASASGTVSNIKIIYNRG